MKIWSVIIAVIGVSAAMLLIAFGEKGDNRSVCNKVVITIDNQLENHFIDDNDVRSIITNGLTEPLEGASFGELKIRTLENRLLENNYIESTEIYRDLKGTLSVNVLLRRPQARVVQTDGPDAYIAGDGTILPVSGKFTSRVILISGPGSKEIVESGNVTSSPYKPIHDLVQFINADEFWRAQIAQIVLEKDGELKLLPQVTKQVIEFGEPDNIEDKFRRLNVFYTQILPRKGWNNYDRVNVKYENQIICE